MTRRALLLAATALALAACAPRPLTETIVVIDADAPTRSLGGAMRFEVRGGPGRDPSAWPTPMMRMTPLLQPLEIGIVPDGDDPSRSYEVHAVALDYAGMPVAEARVVSGFREGEVHVLRMRVEHACAGVSCGPGMSCGAGGMCHPDYVDAVSLPANAPVDFSGTYNLMSTVVSNGCMIGADATGPSMGITVTVMQSADGHAHADIGGVWAPVYDFYVGTHMADGIVVDNHLTAVLVGTKPQSTGTCNPYTVNAVVDLDLSPTHMVTGTVAAYAVTGGAPSCAALTGCTTVFGITGMRTM